MNPLISERNFIPTFTGELLMKGVSGVTRLFQMETTDDDDCGEMLSEQLLVTELFTESTTLAV